MISVRNYHSALDQYIVNFSTLRSQWLTLLSSSCDCVTGNGRFRIFNPHWEFRRLDHRRYDHSVGAKALNVINRNRHFGGPIAPKPLERLFKWHIWLRRRRHADANFGFSRFKGSVAAHAWFLCFKVPCASLQVGPLNLSTPLTAN